MSTEPRPQHENARVLNIKPAANFFEFVRESFPNLKLFPRQIQEAASVFGEWCDNCNPDLYLLRETYEEIASIATFTVHDVCPRCGGRKAVDAHWHSALSLGMRSGKGFLLAAMALYAEHRTLCRQPLLHTARDEGGWLRISIISNALGVSHDVIGVANQLRATSPWFIDHVELLRRNELPLPYLVQNEYAYPHLHLITCAVPRSLARIRGQTDVFVGLHEAAWFDYTGDEHDTPLGDVLRACNIGCHTIREAALSDPTIFGGYVTAVSSPYQVHDTFDNMLKKTGARYYSARIPTWNISPGHTRDLAMNNPTVLEDSYYNERDFGVRIVHKTEISGTDGSGSCK